MAVIRTEILTTLEVAKKEGYKLAILSSEDDSLIFELLDIGIVNEYMAEYIKKRLSGAKQGSLFMVFDG